MSTTGKNGSSARAWLRAIELTTAIASEPGRTLPLVIEQMAEHQGAAPALLSDRECLNYRELAARTRQYARWALEAGLDKGDVVCLLMPNRPEYLAVWLGLTRVGIVVALLNTNLVGASLAHSIKAVGPRRLVVDRDCVGMLGTALPHLESCLTISICGAADPSGSDDHRGLPGGSEPTVRRDKWDRVELAGQSDKPLLEREQPPVTVADLALYIYTSGTTGLPKAARVTHARLMQWSHWFVGMMEVTSADRIYNCLPMYHSVGGVQAPGALLVMGGSVVVREKFSAAAFWSDVRRWEATIFQYIGELCRYLLHTPVSPDEACHGIRLACGNGMSSEVWERLQARFNIPRILEFYASTEGNVSLFNLEGRVGAIGHIPPYLTHRFCPPLVRYDPERNEPARGADGLCVRCAPGEAGEALGQIVEDGPGIGSRFDGYQDRQATAAKILKDVFKPGDRWFRTGDLLRRDRDGFFYFVDRVGDTFRRKGENVSASEVAGVICAFPGISHANVYGVRMPGLEGRVGMAAVVAEMPGRESDSGPRAGLDIVRFRDHLVRSLPAYARPLFLRLEIEAEVTGTWKYAKTELVRQGYDPDAVTVPVYFDHPEAGEFVLLSRDVYREIQAGVFKL